jgi:uncharacterized repeat protein (TIGR01451 family)
LRCRIERLFAFPPEAGGIVPPVSPAREKAMSALLPRWIALIAIAAAASAPAATLMVTTDHDEKNCRSESGCSTAPNGMGENYPNSTGCSLREALQDIADAGNSAPLSYPECGTPTSGGPNTIDLGTHSIVVNATELNPGDVNGVATLNNGSLPDIGDAATYGAVTITGGTAISCFSNATVNGVVMFREAGGGNLGFDGVHFQNCTAPAAGVAISNPGTGDLFLTGVTFTNIRGTNDTDGGCILHGSGNLTILGGSFTACIADNGSLIPGGGSNGEGGALSIGAVGNSTAVTISGVTFQGNIASANGGAIQFKNTDAISISGSAFQANIANGNTHDRSNAELGGGAIYASNTANQGFSGGDGVNASDFLIFNTSFVGNLAPNGTGGAILLTGGSLTYGSLTIDQTTVLDGSLPGGIIASNFSANQAGGTWDGTPVDPRAGSGGAIYARGNVSILSSSFVGGNASQNANGGAIAYFDGGNSFSPLSIANVTINGNSAEGSGSAIANLKTVISSNGRINLINDTIAGNIANGAGALFNAGSASDVQVSNTIFSDNTNGGNCSGPLTDVAGNLQFNPASGCASIANTGDPKLQSAAPFGGVNALVFVMKLDSGSAASGAGNQPACTASPIVDLDAALNSRPSGKPNCDVGAFESGIVPDLTVNKTHADPFVTPSGGDTYTITVNNGGDDSTSGTVAVADALPSGLTATALSGSGWSCVLGTLTCMRSDALASGSSYPPITLTVDVDTGLSGPLVNSAAVSGGAEANTGNDSVDDPTNLVAPPDLTIAKTHSGNFTKGQIGATYTITVSNVGSGPSSGTVSVVDNLPMGLTATAIGGSGWSCDLPTLTCTRSDVLAAAPAAYPPITVTVDVSATPPAQVINSADVSGGGDVNTDNNHVEDGTTLPVTLQSFQVD